MRREQVEAVLVVVVVYGLALAAGAGLGWVVHVVTRGRMF